MPLQLKRLALWESMLSHVFSLKVQSPGQSPHLPHGQKLCDGFSTVLGMTGFGEILSCCLDTQQVISFSLPHHLMAPRIEHSSRRRSGLAERTVL